MWRLASICARFLAAQHFSVRYDAPVPIYVTDVAARVKIVISTHLAQPLV